MGHNLYSVKIKNVRYEIISESDTHYHLENGEVILKGNYETYKHPYVMFKPNIYKNLHVENLKFEETYNVFKTLKISATLTGKHGTKEVYFYDTLFKTTKIRHTILPFNFKQGNIVLGSYSFTEYKERCVSKLANLYFHQSVLEKYCESNQKW